MKRIMLLLVVTLFSWTEGHALWNYSINGKETIDGITYNLWYQTYSGYVESRGNKVPFKGVGGVTPGLDGGTLAFYEVTALAEDPYHYQGYVSIPSRASSIASGAFANCGALTRVDIPSSISDGIHMPAYIKSGAFSNCPALADVYTEAEHAIPDDAFDEYIYSHAILHVPAGKKATYQNLGGWKKFSNIEEESEVQELENGDTFTAKTVEGVDMEFLVSNAANKICRVGRGISTKQAVDVSTSGTITIPSNINGYDVTGINLYAFYRCDKLTGVVIPEGIEDISYGAFADCQSLTQIELPNSLTHLRDFAFYDCINLTSVSTGNQLKTIDKYAFSDCKSLADISIPSSITTISEGTFYGCSSLNSISMPNGVTVLSDYAFSQCSSLSDVSLPTTVKGIGKNVFERCVSLKSISIPNGVTTISDFAFSQCSSLSDVSLPTTVIELGKYAFDRCESLKSISIPNSVTSIGERAFQGCSALASITIPNGVTAISDYTFYWCTALSNVSLPSTIQTIGIYAFNRCESLKSISIPNGVTVLSDFAFLNCTYLRSISLPSSLKEIGTGVFGLSGLLSINLPSSLEKIGPQAFYGCSNLKTLTIPYKVETLGELIVGYCNDLKSLTVDSSNPYFRSSGNGIIDKSTNMLIHSCPATVIPTDIVGISRLGFACVPGVEEIIIPENIKTLGASAFEECINLNRVIIPASIESIGDEAFLQCESLEQVTILNPIPVAITDNVFHMKETPNSDNTGYTTSDFTTATLYVPYGCKTAYQQAAGWKNFQNIVEMEAPAEPKLVMTGMVIEGDGIVGTPHTYTAYIQNQGQGDFSGSVYVWTKEDSWANPYFLSRAYGTIGAGKKVNFKYVLGVDDGEEDFFYFTSPGTYRFWLTTDAEGQQPIEGEQIFIVTPAATLTAKSYTREYGEENPYFEYTEDKGGFNGTPKISCETDRYSDVGTYDIIIEQGSVDNNYVTYVNGTLTITPATLTVKAGNWFDRQGWDHMREGAYTPTYSGWKVQDDAQVLTRQPQFSTTATAESPMGYYPLNVSGAEAKNYAFEYIPGTLTVVGRPGDVNRDSYVNTTDVVDVVQYIFGYQNVQTVYDADLNLDDNITSTDVSLVVSCIMNNDRPASRLKSPAATGNCLMGLSQDENGKVAVYLQNDVSVVAFQFDVVLAKGADFSKVLLSEARKNGHAVAMKQMENGCWRVLAYSMQNNTLMGNEGLLATLLLNDVDGEVVLTNIHVTDAQLADYALPDVSLSMLTGISTLTEATAPFDIYDLNGRLVRHNATSTKGLHRGIYMINNQKVVIK